MKVLGSKVEVVTAPAESVGGKKLDAEERPVLTTDRIATQDDAAVNLEVGELSTASSMPGIVKAGMKTDVVLVQSAKEAADYLSAGQCGQCRHFSWREGQEQLRRLQRGDEGSEGRELFLKIRNSFSIERALGTTPGYHTEEEETRIQDEVLNDMRVIGKCRAHSQYNPTGPLLVMPDGTCLDIGGEAPNLFESNDSAIERGLEQTREQVLRAAEDANKPR